MLKIAAPWMSSNTSISCLNEIGSTHEVNEDRNELMLNLASEPDVLAVAVEHISNRATDNSDTDVFVITRDTSFLEQCVVRPTSSKWDVHYIDASELLVLTETNFIDLRTLRLVGRLAGAMPIWERSETLSFLRTRARRVALLPAEAALLLVEASAAISAALDETDVGASVLKARSCAYALATLAITFSERRYEKPKWMLDTLRCGSFADLGVAICDSFGGDIVLQADAQPLGDIRHLILEICEAYSWPPLVRGKWENDDYAHVYRTMRDAESLVASNFRPESVVTADHALRLCDVLGSEAPPIDCSAGMMAQWRERRDNLCAKQFSRGTCSLHQMANRIIQIGKRIEANYKSLVADRQELYI